MHKSTSTRPRRVSRLWSRVFGNPRARKRRASPTVGPDPLHPAGVDLDPRCPTCGGSRVQMAHDRRGRPMRVPCSECAPNDALGG